MPWLRPSAKYIQIRYFKISACRGTLANRASLSTACLLNKRIWLRATCIYQTNWKVSCHCLVSIRSYFQRKHLSSPVELFITWKIKQTDELVNSLFGFIRPVWPGSLIRKYFCLCRSESNYWDELTIQVDSTYEDVGSSPFIYPKIWGSDLKMVVCQELLSFCG